MGESPAEEMASKLKEFDKVTGLTIRQPSGMVIVINVDPGQAFGHTSPLAGFSSCATSVVRTSNLSPLPNRADTEGGLR
jgi:hypothetical protein